MNNSDTGELNLLRDKESIKILERPPNLKINKDNYCYSIENNYITDQIKLFEENVNEIIKEINIAGENWKGTKEDWNKIYFPKLYKIKFEMDNFMKMLKQQNIKISKQEDITKFDETISYCFTMMLIGESYFPN